MAVFALTNNIKYMDQLRWVPASKSWDTQFGLINILGII